MEEPITQLNGIADPQPQPLFKKRTAKKTAIRKRAATPPPAGANDDDDSYSSESESGQRVKRRRKTGVITVTSDKPATNPTSDLSTTPFTASRTGGIENTNDATKQSNWFDTPSFSSSSSSSSKALLGTTRALPSPSNPSDIPNDGNYRGNSAYQSFIPKNPNAPSRQIGPLKAPTNVRTITVTDFAPDVCKDYKQTGWCGFGDSCKFLHAREDYKQGWELDRDWEIGTKGRKAPLGKKHSSKDRTDVDDADDEEAEDAKLEGIPFACLVCKKPYRNPIVTKCGHYFCEACALQRYRKSPACLACGSGTGGVFNSAKGLKKLLEKKRERARKRREKRIEEGESVGSEDDDVEEQLEDEG